MKYKGVATDGDTGFAWIDRNLKMVIKWEGERSAAELQNIRAEPQSASLFQVPEGYELFDLAAAQQSAREKNRATAPPQKKPPTH